MKTQRWNVGAAGITSIVEDEVARVPPAAFFPGATSEQVQAHAAWLVPDFADEQGRVVLRVQAFVVELGTRRIVVDPCVGNGKRRALPFWNDKHWPFLERFAEAGFSPERIDTVVHTHLHADHIGWDTHARDGAWVPTFTNARHLYSAAELEYAKTKFMPGDEEVYADSIQPIFAAGLADVVPEDLVLGPGLRLEPSPGHTPGHTSLWIESNGETALISGDFLHHPVQCAELQWAEVGDADPELARTTRRRMLARAEERGALFLGTHFATRPAGRIRKSGDAFRFEPV